MGTTATTHFMDSGDDRYLSLSFTQAGSTVTTVLPTDPERLPYGFYLLMVLFDNTPSTARIIRIDAGEGTTVGITEPPEVLILRPKLRAYPSPRAITGARLRVVLRPSHHRRDDADPAGGVCEVAAGDEAWIKEI